MHKALYGALGLLVTVVHFVVFYLSFCVGFALGDGGRQIPVYLQVSTAVLGVPLMYLLYVADFGKQWFSDDSIIIGLAVCNSLLWGTAFGAILSWYLGWRAKRRARA